MSRAPASLLALVAAVAVASALASCGGGDAKLLPGNTAQEISENLDSVQRLVDEGACVDAEDAALEVATQVEALNGIDPKLKQALRDGANRLNEVVDTCEEAPEDTVEEETAPETTESTERDAKKEEKEKKPKKPKKEPETAQPEEEAKPTKEKEEPQPEDKGDEESPPAEEGGQSGGIGPGGAAGGG